MTEAEWLNCDDKRPWQLKSIHKVASIRKLHLIAAAYIRGAQACPEYADAARCDDIIEAVADQQSPPDLGSVLKSRPGHWGFTNTIAAPQEPMAIAEGIWGLCGTYRSATTPTVRDFVRLLHEVVGNPFRRVSFDPEWRTSTVLAMAKEMYESRDFSAMPIFADALQDAGCDNDDILTHCRDETVMHVRGCWVVDLVLGRE